MIDSHLHLVNFLQQPLPAKALAEAVTSGDAERLVVFGIPVKKKWAITEPERPTYYLDDNAPCGTYSLTDELVASLVLTIDGAARDSVAPLICGFDPTDRLAPDHVETMLSRQDIWRGVGEVIAMLRRGGIPPCPRSGRTQGCPAACGPTSTPSRH